MRATVSPNQLREAIMRGSEGPKWGTEKRKYPACSLDCECFDIGMAHEREHARKYCEQLIIAIRLICDERGLKQNNKNLNELIGEVHGRWVKDLQREKGVLR
jgi:hypothetical protein